MSLTEQQSIYTSTADMLLVYRPRGYMTAISLCARVVSAESKIIQDTMPILVAMAKLDDPARALHTTNTWSSWLVYKRASWMLWLNSSKFIEALDMLTRDQWQALYNVATEDEKSLVFCQKKLIICDNCLIGSPCGGLSSPSPISSLSSVSAPVVCPLDLPD